MRTSKKLRATLRCEGLEGRECPAVQVFNVAGTLTVVGDLAANNIQVTDNGSDVAVLVDGNPAANSPFTGVTSVVIRGAGGDDSLSYTSNNTSSVTSVRLQGGIGNDTLTLNGEALGTASASASTIQFVMVGGQGADTIDASLGSIVAGDTVSLVISGGSGVDNITVGLVAKADGTFSLQANGDQGNDSISVSANLAHDSAGSVSLTSNGGQGSDNVTLTVAAEVDGTLTLQANGNQGADSISLSTTIAPDSTGTVTIGTGGGQGVDTIDLDVTAVVGSALNILAGGGMGIDTINSTTDIRTGSTGTINSRIDGVLKKDTLTSLVTVDGVKATASALDALVGAGNWAFVLDGNLGFDTGTYTDGVVQAINVEVKNPV